MTPLLRAFGLGLLLMPLPLAAQEVANAPIVELRGLDRLAGELSEIEMRVGGTTEIGDLFVTVEQCRYPVDNPAGDAFAYLVVQDRRVEDPVFQGWMVASSPALNALDHMRYDVWVIRCKTPSAEATGDATSN